MCSPTLVLGTVVSLSTIRLDGRGRPFMASGSTRRRNPRKKKVSDGIRTHDRLDHNQELYQLSYAHRGKLNLPLPPPWDRTSVTIGACDRGAFPRRWSRPGVVSSPRPFTHPHSTARLDRQPAIRARRRGRDQRHRRSTPTSIAPTNSSSSSTSSIRVSTSRRPSRCPSDTRAAAVAAGRSAASSTAASAGRWRSAPARARRGPDQQHLLVPRTVPRTRPRSSAG